MRKFINALITALKHTFVLYLYFIYRKILWKERGSEKSRCDLKLKSRHKSLMRERSVAVVRLCQGYATRWVLAGTRNNICSSFHRDVRDTREGDIYAVLQVRDRFTSRTARARARSTKSEFHRRTSNGARILFVQRCGFYRQNASTRYAWRKTITMDQNHYFDLMKKQHIDWLSRRF